MTSLLITFCYVSSVSSTEKTINGVASYKAGKDDYRDVIFKGNGYSIHAELVANQIPKIFLELTSADGGRYEKRKSSGIKPLLHKKNPTRSGELIGGGDAEGFHFAVEVGALEADGGGGLRHVPAVFL